MRQTQTHSIAPSTIAHTCETRQHMSIPTPPALWSLFCSFSIFYVVAFFHPVIAVSPVGTICAMGLQLPLKTSDGMGEKASLPVIETKNKLISFITSMSGTKDDFQVVEDLVNSLESEYKPPQTLSFLNLMMEGDWQLLFSTNLLSPPNPARFRLREVLQKIRCDNLKGKVSNVVTWDLSETSDANFLSFGSFEVLCSYTINQGARMVLSLDNHIMRPQAGTPIPRDLPGLVGLIHRAMPKEMFDPAEHAADTTYIDGDFRIVRYTGPRLEGVRDIFVRKGTFQVAPPNLEQ